MKSLYALLTQIFISTLQFPLVLFSFVAFFSISFSSCQVCNFTVMFQSHCSHNFVFVHSRQLFPEKFFIHYLLSTKQQTDTARD